MLVSPYLDVYIREGCLGRFAGMSKVPTRVANAGSQFKPEKTRVISHQRNAAEKHGDGSIAGDLMFRTARPAVPPKIKAPKQHKQRAQGDVPIWLSATSRG
jgi:hypothetical protein